MLSGRDDGSASYELPKEPEREVELLFRHIGGFVEKAGGKVGDLVNVTFFTMDDAYRGFIDKEWSRMFPQEGQRPARHTLNVAPSGLRGERVQAVVVARVAG
jgi:enamine deaminase RidA (YjgF/YER057c/UK114 family)